VILMRRCERCMGTGSLESSDSTEDGWWDCSTCKGTGKVADRRRPDPRLAGVVEGLYVCPNGHRSSVTRIPNSGVRRCFFCGEVATPVKEAM